MPELIDAVRAYEKEGIYPFHMPGHKKNKNFIPNDLLNLDITELYGTDNLHKPENVIKEAQENAARLWKADNSFLLVNGSSCGIMAALMAVCKEGDTVLAARNSHISFYNGLVISGARPLYIMPRYLKCGLAGGITAWDVEKALKKDINIRAVFITSPTYEGFVSDIASIAEIVHAYGKILIVDEAHGAHFTFSDYFPASAIEQGADIVIQSLHKTLPALGQSAVLHVKGGRVDLYEMKQNLSLVQTTSPSYLLMSVMQDMIYKLSEKNDIFDGYVNKLKRFRKTAESLKCIKLISKDIRGESGIFDLDQGKLVFLIEKGGKTGSEAEEILRDKYKIQIEAAGRSHFIAMTSVADTEEGFDRLSEAVINIDGALNADVKKETPIFLETLPKIAMTPRETRNKKKSVICINESIGKISAEHIAPYPPGVPVLAAGELITGEVIEYIKALVINKNKIYIVAEG